MSKFNQLVHVRNVKGAGISTEGEVAFLDIDDGGKRIVRLGMFHLDIPKLIASLEHLNEAVAKERKKHGKNLGGRAVSAKKTQSVRVGIDQTRRAILLEFLHPNGTSTYVAADPAQIADLTERIGAAKAAIAQLPAATVLQAAAVPASVAAPAAAGAVRAKRSRSAPGNGASNGAPAK
jgi:hypothetical protein